MTDHTPGAPPNGASLAQLQGRRCFLLDTNVLLHDATALEAFDQHDIIVTVDVLEELDRFKRENDERGRNARRVIRTIDTLRAAGNLREGVPLPQGGRLFVLVDTYVDRLPRGLDGSIPDNRILAAGLWLKAHGADVVFVTKDINARVKGDVLGLVCEDLQRSTVNFDELYTGWRELEVPDARVDRSEERRVGKECTG
jgi:PhoH-like ATPase